MNFLFSFLALTATASEVKDPVENIGEAADAVDTIAKDINAYGLAVVIMAVFFVIFILLTFFVLRNNAKMTQYFMTHQNHSDKLEEELLSKFIDNALDAKLGKKSDVTKDIVDEVKSALKPMQQAAESIAAEQTIDNQVHKDLVGTYIDVNMAFKDASRSTLTSLNCSRVAIYVFHNGNKSMHGLPFFKMSCVHEWTNKGSNTLRGKSHTDMPLHLFADFIEDLYKKGSYKAEDVHKSATKDPSIEEFIAYSKTKALYLSAVKDDNDVIAGFIAVEFEEADTFETDSVRNEEIRAVVDKMNTKIAPILTYHYMYRK